MTEQLDDRLRRYLAAAVEPPGDLADRAVARALTSGAVTGLRALLPLGGARRRRPAAPALSLGAAVAVGLVVVAATAGAVTLQRLSRTGTRPVRPAATALPAATTSPGIVEPPHGQQLVWVRDGASGHVRAIDWAARPVPVPGVPQPQHWDFEASPDGHLLMEANADGRQFFDSDGNDLGSLQDSSEHWPGSLVWDRGGQGLCAIRVTFVAGQNRNTVVKQILDLVIPGRPNRDVADFSRPAHGIKDRNAVACDIAADRAAVVSFGTGYEDLYQVRLSTGAILRHRYYPTRPPGIVVSADATLVAENASAQDGQTVVRRLSDGLGTKLPAGLDVAEFSGDGRLVLVVPRNAPPGVSPLSPPPTTPAAAGRLQAIEWQTGRVAWTMSTQQTLYRTLAQPDGQSFALEMNDCPLAAPADQTHYDCASGVKGGVVLIDGSGHQQVLQDLSLASWTS